MKNVINIFEFNFAAEADFSLEKSSVEGSTPSPATKWILSSDGRAVVIEAMRPRFEYWRFHKCTIGQAV